MNFYPLNKQKSNIFFILFFIICFSYSSAQDGTSINSVNVQAAISSLNNAGAFYSAGEWQAALTAAQLGTGYDTRTADFPYLEALCGVKLNLPNADILEKVEAACAEGMVWRHYDVNSARLLCAAVNYKMQRYSEALAIIKLLPFTSADSDYIKAASLYGLGKDEDARFVINEAMSSYTFDSRFAKLFFLMERGKKITASAKQLVEYILPRLYAWQDEDPSLLIFASPYETKSEENIRRLKLYRNMYLPFTDEYDSEALYNHSYSILLSLRYGIIDEQTAVSEFFNLKSNYFNPFFKRNMVLHTMYENHLIELLRIVGSSFLREKIRETLFTYEGLLLDDTNGDQIVNSKIYYKNGRPFFAEFDTAQDGYPEYMVECSFGIPSKIYGKRNSYSIVYEEYPSVKTYTSEEKVFVMRPSDLKWNPVILTELNLQLYDRNEKTEAFFSLKLNTRIEKLHERYLTYSCVYSEEKDTAIEGGIKKIFFDKGEPIRSEIRAGKNIYSETNYKNGFPALEKADKDGDGYFETISEYDSQGVLKIISADLNKNKFYEYAETYNKDGSIVKTWDGNEDGKIEITHTQYKGGKSKTEWLHPKTNKKVAVYFEDGIPYELSDGKKTRRIVSVGKFPVYWLRHLPDIPEKINEEIINVFNQNDLRIASYTFTINEMEVFAVRSGGIIFAEILTGK